MKNLVRGGVILSMLTMFVVFIYAQATTQKTTESTLAIANSSQATIEDTNTESNLINQQTKDGKKLVKSTASVRATGASRGGFSATAYCLSGKTAMGHGVRRGIIAADPRVLKLGSRVYVYAGAWSGSYLVSDTGGAIKGKKIDIWVPGCSEARKFGRRSVQVFSAQ